MSSQDRAKVFEYLNDQKDIIFNQKTLRLNTLSTNLDLAFPDVIEYTFQFINSVDPPYEIAKLILSDNSLNELPYNLRLLSKNVRYLDLHNNNFIDLPIELVDFNHLEFLDLSHNKLTNISRAKLSKLTNLKLLSLKSNQIKYLPPILGELPNLNLIEVADNPLLLPSIETINKFKQLSDIDWVQQLKAYLVINSLLIESKLESSAHKISHSKHPSLSSNSNSSTPQIQRSKSISETKTKASKAARRMGLIIKKPEDINGTSFDDSYLTSNDFPSPLNFPNSFSPLDTPSNIVNTQLSNSITVGTSTITTTSSSKLSYSHSFSQTHSTSNSPPNTPPILNLPSLPKPRSRSNTLIEIDRMLDNDDDGTEHRLGSYFRRLSTLAEVPIAETLQQGSDHYKSLQIPPTPDQSHVPPRSNSLSNVSSENISVSQEDDHSHLQHSHTRSLSIKTPPTLKSTGSTLTATTTNTLSGVPSSQDSPKRKEMDISTIVLVSRKILFSFSELHTSIRRFSGFSSDRKVTMKMVSHLYNAKACIDSLVEILELIEDGNTDANKISDALHSCVTSFKTIMMLLSDNLQAFVNKIDICFIRMLYLTVFGSFNEICNAYKILVPNHVIVKSKPGSSVSVPFAEQNSSGTFTEDLENIEDIDGKLYDSIDIATSKAQDVFGELTRAISKSAMASAETAHDTTPQLATKVKDLTTVCVSSMDIVRRLKSKSLTIRNNPNFTTKKLFWDDINLFLKTIIQTFSAVKNLMKDLPILNDIRLSMAMLTKSTKDVTILLEASSYKNLSTDSNTHPPTFSSIPSTSNIFNPISGHPSSHQSSYHSSAVNLNQLGQPPVRTPLAAALGPAAQAILPLNNDTNVNLNTVISPSTINEYQTVSQTHSNNGTNPFDGILMSTKEKKE